MEFDFSTMPPAQCYKLLVSVVVPRPIALVTSLGPTGVVNAAPYSFFNLMGDDPPILIISIEKKPTGLFKDTQRNIQTQGEFVVNLVDESIAQKMHACSQDFAADVSELTQVGLTPLPSVLVKPPRVAQAPVALECTLYREIPISDNRLLVIGQVRYLHSHEGVFDPLTLRVNMDQYFPIGRLYADRYTTTRGQFTADSSPDYIEGLKALGRI